MREINKDTNLYISISSNPSNFGTQIYNSIFHKLKINAIYKSLKVDNLDSLKKNINFFKIKGISVSMPYKEKVVSKLDKLDAVSKKILIVNTIKNIKGKLYGYNADYFAVRNIFRDIQKLKKFSFLLFGYGAISKTVIFALNSMGIKDIFVDGRNKKKIKMLQKKFKCNLYSKDICFKKKLFLINCSPLGMKGKYVKKMPFNLELINRSSIVMDLINFPLNTRLLSVSKKFKKKIIPGYLVSLNQIKKQFEIYTEKKISKELVKKIFLKIKSKKL